MTIGKNGGILFLVGFVVQVVFDHNYTFYSWLVVIAAISLYLGAYMFFDRRLQSYRQATPKSLFFYPKTWSVSVFKRGAIHLFIGLTVFAILYFSSSINFYVSRLIIEIDSVHAVAKVEKKIKVELPRGRGGGPPSFVGFVVLGFDLDGKHVSRSIKQSHLRNATLVGDRERIIYLKSYPNFFVVE